MSPPNEPQDVLYRVKRGLAGYISYLAACEMNEAFSEYVLYEPLLRIMTARGYAVECEVECPGIEQPQRGDRKRLDFVAEGHSLRLALEVKWAKNPRPDVETDIEKLTACVRHDSIVMAFLCVFGRKSSLLNLLLPPGQFRERGEGVYADFGKTKYGCRVYELVSQ